MMAIVVKSFATTLHRFVVGQIVDESDIDGPLDMMALISRGFLLPGTVMPGPDTPEPTDDSSKGA